MPRCTHGSRCLRHLGAFPMHAFTALCMHCTYVCHHAWVCQHLLPISATPRCTHGSRCLARPVLLAYGISVRVSFACMHTCIGYAFVNMHTPIDSCSLSKQCQGACIGPCSLAAAVLQWLPAASRCVYYGCMIHCTCVQM